MLLVLSAAAACGRTGLDREAPAIDAAPPPIDAPAVLSCSPPRFSVVDTMSTLSAISTANGYDVFPVDSASVVHGLAYNLAGNGALTSVSSDVTIASAASGAVGVTTAGDQVVVSMPFNNGTAGTQLIQLDKTLTAVGPKIMINAWGSQSGSLAGTIAYNGIDSVATLGFANGEFDARLVSLDGVISPQRKVIDAGVSPLAATIVRTSNGYLVSWFESQAGEVDAELLDNNLAIVQPAMKLGPAEGPVRAAYLASADRYAVAWWEKIGSLDFVFVGLLDGNFAPVVAPINVGGGTFPDIIAGDSDFLVAWNVGMTQPPGIAAARVRPDGSMIQAPISSSGGTEITWDLVSHAGQPALVWLESGGTAPNLWIDPLCAAP